MKIAHCLCISSGIVIFMPRKYGVMIDFDGVLIDMAPFAYELDEEQPRRWHRFFAHTDEATPLMTGLELIERLSALGWSYAVSTTRPAWTLGTVRRWIDTQLPVPPVAAYARRTPAQRPLACKAEHYWRTRRSSRYSPAVCTLFIDDELAVVEGLADIDIPAIHIGDIAVHNERDLLACLKYSRKLLYEDEQRRRNKTG